MVLSRSQAPPPPPDMDVVDEVVRRALEEDTGGVGDLTSEHLVPPDARARGRLVARAPGVLAGLGVFARVFELCDPDVSVELLAADGARVAPDQDLARVVGRARALLLAERTALNLLQRLSGVATRTARFVELLEPYPEVRVLDTRKTTPGLRHLEKYAVRCGGGHNHRVGLFDQAMVKENHLALAGRPVEEAVRDLRARIGDRVLTCEATTPDEARGAVRGGADVVLLDNMIPDAMASLVPELRALGRERGRPLELEASGGITERGLRAVAASGVDRVSVGALTHSVPALDLSFYLETGNPKTGSPP